MGGDVVADTPAPAPAPCDEVPHMLLESRAYSRKIFEQRCKKTFRHNRHEADLPARRFMSAVGVDRTRCDVALGRSSTHMRT